MQKYYKQAHVQILNKHYDKHLSAAKHPLLNMYHHDSYVSLQ